MNSKGEKIPRRKGRVSKTDWLEAALAELERGGVDAVRIERLAEQLSVAKSGFYWHFKNRDELLRQVLDYWSSEFTEVIRTIPKALSGEPAARLRNIAKIIDENGLARHDLAIRAWAAHDEVAADTVRKVTNFRLNFIGGIFEELGFEGDELEARTRLFVCYHSMENAVLPTAAKRRQSRLWRQQLDLLTRK